MRARKAEPLTMEFMENLFMPGDLRPVNADIAPHVRPLEPGSA